MHFADQNLSLNWFSRMLESLFGPFLHIADNDFHLNWHFKPFSASYLHLQTKLVSNTLWYFLLSIYLLQNTQLYLNQLSSILWHFPRSLHTFGIPCLQFSLLSGTFYHFLHFECIMRPQLNWLSRFLESIHVLYMHFADNAKISRLSP